MRPTPCQVPASSIQPFGHNKHGRKFGGSVSPHFGEGGAGSPSNAKATGPRSSSIPSDILVWRDMGRKLERGLCPLGGGGAAWVPSNTMWPGPRPTCVPSFILIRATVWSQCKNVTDGTGEDRQDRQRTDSIGRTVLQTVAQKRFALCYQTVSVGPIANLKGPYFQPSLSVCLRPAQFYPSSFNVDRF